MEASGWRIDEGGNKYIRVKGIRWYTNIEIKQRHVPLDLRGTYYKSNESAYPQYDGYDAINIDSVSGTRKVPGIPCDYDGVMGVPITFFDKYCPEQFEIIGVDRYTVPKEFLVGGRVAINGKPKYARILIRKKSEGGCNT